MASQVNVSVVSSKTNIFGEVSDFVFAKGKVRGVVDVDVVDMFSSGLRFDTVFVYVIMDFLDDPCVEEVMGENFVRGREDYSLGVLTLKNGSGKSLINKSIVRLDTSIEGCFIKNKAVQVRDNLPSRIGAG